MISDRHYLSITVNGKELELESQDKPSLRMNATIYNPEKIDSTETEYSFSFSIPCTPRNNQTFGFANTPSVKGKFIRNYDCYVYADNVEIFHGTLRLSSIEDGAYKCNLISLKNSSIDDIFGERVMSDLKWEVPYVGVPSQNAQNQLDNPDYFFPLVSYGAFQKDPYYSVNGGSDSDSINYYTGTNIIDKWTKFYAETFIPSPKLIEVIKRIIEQSNYTYSGDVFTDDIINKIYLSSYISDDQVPNYNIGGERGKVTVQFNKSIEGYTYTETERGARQGGRVAERDLTYPEDYHYSLNTEFGNDKAIVESLWNNATASNDDLWQDGFIVVPASGLYKLTMDLTVQMEILTPTFEDSYPYKQGDEIRHKKMLRTMNITTLPFDVQLVKNNSSELEFIATEKINWQNSPVSPKEQLNDITDYPHEAKQFKNSVRGRADNQRNSYYYIEKGKTRGYDPSVNEDFIMGLSTSAQCFAIRKRGKSYDPTFPDFGYNNYECDGYNHMEQVSVSTWEEEKTTAYQQWHSDIPASSVERRSPLEVSGKGYAIVWLEKGDMLTLKQMDKEYKWYMNEQDSGYISHRRIGHTISGTVSLEAYSPRQKDYLNSWNAESSFDKNLNLGQFLSNSELQKDFFNNFLTTFNLSAVVDGKNVDISRNIGKTISQECIDVDDRVNECTMESIDFPTSIDVKWSIDDEESGFYHSISDEHINDDDWKEWADRGSEKIEFIENKFSTNTIEKTSKFSYNWWMDFNLKDYWSQKYTKQPIFIENADITLSLPIIAKDENFIDGGDYDSMEKSDGRSLKQRMFFKGEMTEYLVPNRNRCEFDGNGNIVSCSEYIPICLPTPLYNGKDVLNYKNSKDSLLGRYFSVDENVDSNYCIIECYITPSEYKRLKNGAMVRYNNDRHRICSITGFDASGKNTTKLKLMKL